MCSRRPWVRCVSQAVAMVADPPTAEPKIADSAVRATRSKSPLLFRSYYGAERSHLPVPRPELESHLRQCPVRPSARPPGAEPRCVAGPPARLLVPG